jgi:hypothetical protein
MRWSSAKSLGIRAALSGTSLVLGMGCAQQPEATKEHEAARGVERQLIDVAVRTDREVARELRQRDVSSRTIGASVQGIQDVDPGGSGTTTSTPGGAFFGGVRPDTTTSSLASNVEGTPNVRVDPPRPPTPVVKRPTPPRPGGWGNIRAACGRG